MIAAVAEAEAKIAPVPLGRHALQATLVVQRVHQHPIQGLVDQLADGRAQRMPQQRRQRGFRLFITLGIDDPMHQTT